MTVKWKITFIVSYGYNDNSELISLTYPSGRTINYQRNNIGRVTSVTTTFDGENTTVSDTISYLPFGPSTSMTLGNGLTITNAYDQLYRLTNTTAGSIYNRDYSFYADGSVKAIVDNIDHTASQNFTYDNQNRLIAAQGKYGSYAWSYDNVGNRLSQTLEGEATTYTFETGTNRLAKADGAESTEYFYDASGNMVSRGNTDLQWDQNNRLLSAGINAETVGAYGYDYRNLRTVRTVDGETFYTLYDQSGNMLAETNAQGEVLREFAYLNGTRISLFDYTLNPEVYVAVSSSEGEFLQDVTVYAFDEQNNYTNINAVTDEEGIAIFMRDDFGEGPYTFQVNYLGGQFFSEAEIVRKAERIDIVIPVEPVTMTVTMADATQPDAKVYVYTADGTYLGIYGTTDGNGQVLFTLAEGVEYLFKTEILGNEYWSSPITVADGGSSGSIDTGGGLLTLNVGESETLPLSSLQTYLYNTDGTYLGLAATTDSEGNVSYSVPAGTYQIRVDYLGYQLWSDAYTITEPTVGTFYIPHQDVQVFVGYYKNDPDSKKKGKKNNIKKKPLSDVTLSLFTASGTELDLQAVTDDNGYATFHVPELAFKVQADYLDQIFWSDAFTWQDTEIMIETGTTTITVTSLGKTLRGVPITLVTQSGEALDYTVSTNGKGEADFRTPAGTYLFRADYQGHEYMSAEVQVVAYENSYETIDVGGGKFVLTLKTDSGEVLKRIPTTLFTASGIELDKSYKTDRKGQVSYKMADGSYLIRIDYLGYSYWTDEIKVPEMTELTYVIEHRDVKVSAVRDYNGDIIELKNVKVRLWTPDDTKLGVSSKIRKKRPASFSLPEQEYVFKVKYLEQLFAGQPSVWTDTEIIIEEGMAEITLELMGEPIKGVSVSVFNESGVNLEQTATTSVDGKVEFRLPEGNYTFKAKYNETKYQAAGTVVAHQVTPININIGNNNGVGFVALIVYDGTSPLSSLPCFLYNSSGEYQNQTAITDSSGMVSFEVGDGDYYVEVEYMGGKFRSDTLNVPTTLFDMLLIEHQQVSVTISGDNGEASSPLAGVRCYLVTEEGVDAGINATTDEQGVASFNVPFNSYVVRAEYLGRQFESEVFDWYNSSLTVPLGSLNLHVMDLGADAAGAKVYLFAEDGTYLDVTTETDSAGSATLAVPAGPYQVRVDYNNTQYWSDVLHVLAYQDNPVILALDLLALDASNNPHPVRVNGKAPEYRPMVAANGEIDGLLSSAVANTDPQTFYYISDHLRTAQLLVDEEGVVVWQGNYSPFGAVDVVINELENNSRFPGQYFDTETGLYYNWHRYYDPETGQYISADPIGLAGGMNLYAYVGGNPVNGVDPSGLKCVTLLSITIPGLKTLAGSKLINTGKWLRGAASPEIAISPPITKVPITGKLVPSPGNLSNLVSTGIAHCSALRKLTYRDTWHRYGTRIESGYCYSGCGASFWGNTETVLINEWDTLRNETDLKYTQLRIQSATAQLAAIACTNWVNNLNK